MQGIRNIAVPHNPDFLGISLENTDTVVLSHGHMDHVGALKEIFNRTGRGTRLIVHPDAFLPRALQFPTMDRISFPLFPPRDTLTGWGAAVVENKGLVVISGCAHAGIINSILYARSLCAAQQRRHTDTAVAGLNGDQQ